MGSNHQMIGSSELRLLIGFLFVSLSVTSPCNEAQEKEGSYTNLCGLCVGGSTGLAETEGLDECGVCFGGGGGGGGVAGSCVQCKDGKRADGCGMCLERGDQGWNNCTRLKYVSPGLADLAVERGKITFSLHGIKFNASTLGQLKCSISRNQTTLEGGAEIPSVEAKELADGNFQLEVDSSLLSIGEYIVLCSSTTFGSVPSDSVLMIVDSRKVQVEKVAPQFVKSGIYFQPTFYGTNISKETLKNLICFVRNGEKGKKLLAISSGHVQNNTILCDELMTTVSGDLKIGAAASIKAAEEGAAPEFSLEARSVPLSPVTASFSTDLRQLLITFNQNIDSKTCEELFTGSTKRIFGAGWDCWLRGNKLTIQLGKDAKVRPGSRLFLRHSPSAARENPNVRSMSADLSSSTVVLQETNNEIVPPHYRVVGPRMACRNSRSLTTWPSPFKDSRIRSLSDSFTTIEVQGLAGQYLRYNWTVGLAQAVNTTKGVSQRDILLRWLSIRSLEKALKKSIANSTGEQIMLNNNLMLSGVEYVLTVRGENYLGEVGAERNISLKLVENVKNIPRASEVSVSSLASSAADAETDPAEPRKEPRSIDDADASSSSAKSLCASTIPPDVVLLGSAAVFVDTDFWVEATVSCCDGQVLLSVLNQVQYKWSIEEKSKDGENIDTGSQNGKRLHIPPGLLRGGTRYIVECHLVLSGTNVTSGPVLGYASMDIATLERGVDVRVNVTSVVVGISQKLVLDASTSADMDNKPGILKFDWNCFLSDGSNEPCRMPGSKKDILKDRFESDFKKSTLVLPPGSLPVGRYVFMVRASKPASSSRASGNATVRITVVGGVPASISIPPTQPILVNPEDGFVLSAIVGDIRTGCRIFWSFVQTVGYLYFDLSAIGLADEINIVADDETYKEVILEFPRQSANWSGLVDDAQYLLRITAVCPGIGRDMPIESYAEVVIETDAAPLTGELQVDPKNGAALSTMFKFSTIPAYDQITDHPLSYTFGFRLAEQSDDTNPVDQFFHTSTQQLWAYAFLPCLSASRPTRIQSLMRVCDARKICRMIDGPLISTRPPSQLSTEAIQSIGQNFGTLLASQEYDDALILAETTLSTLALADNKTLYQLASNHIEEAVRSEMRKFQSKLKHSRTSLMTALRFLDAASATLKHGSFSQSMLQEIVAFKDNILRLLRKSGVNERIKRDTSAESIDQQNDVLKPEMVKTFLSISETAILNLNDREHALSEKRKLLQNLTFYMDALCSSLKASSPIFIGSKVVSFSVQKINLQTKSRDELAVPDWRSAKSGGVPVNATGLVMLGPEISGHYSKPVVCMGAAIFPSDYLSESITPLKPNFIRFSAVYQVKIFVPSEAPIPNDFEGLRLYTRSTHFTMPIWTIPLERQYHLECAVWNENSWDTQPCALVKLATMSNKPAVECECSILGYHSILATLGDRTTSTSTTTATTPQPTEPQPTEPKPTEVRPQQLTTTESPQPFTTQVSSPLTTNSPASSDQPITTVKTITRLPPGVPTTNSSQNYTFKINENFNTTVGERRTDFTAKLKQQILDQVEMPANMIASIDIAPGSILVTLHLVDTDVRTVDEVVPALASALQSGQLNVQDIDGRHLSVPAQSLQMLQWRTHPEHTNLLPWIATSCSVFSLACFTAFLAAAIMVRRKHYDLQLTEEQSVHEDEKTPTYRRFHLEESLDGSEATLARVRNNAAGPYVIGTVANHAAAMGTNMASSAIFHNWLLKYELKPPLSPGSNKDEVDPANRDRDRDRDRVSDDSRSGSSSGRGSSGSRHRRLLRPSAEDCTPIIRCEEPRTPQDSDDRDSGIVVVGRQALSASVSNPLGSGHSSRNIEPPPILPGTPSDEKHKSAA